MVKDPIRSHDTTIGEAAVLARTGRGRTEWFALLDAAGALGWDHATTARWLLEEHAVDPWWTQALAVGYQQARGLRAPGQRSDGRYEANTTKTIPVPAEEVFTWVVDPERRAQWLDAEPEVRGATPPRSVRWAWADGSRVTVHLQAIPGRRTRVAVQHRDLPDAAALPTVKAYWSERLALLAATLDPR